MNPDEVVLKFGLFNFSGICSTPIRTVEFKVNIIPLVTDGKTDAFGGWTPSRIPTEEDLQAFGEAMEGLDGVGYTPLSVQSQVVKGTNYRFLCEATTVTLEPQTFQAMVMVYKPLPGEGNARIMAITPMEDGGSNSKGAVAVVHLDDLKVNTRDTLKQFIATLASCKLEKGTYFSGTVHMKDLPTGLRQAEVQGVIGDMLLDMTLTSTDMPTQICLDHSRKRLLSYVSGGKIRPLDIQIVPSCGMQLRKDSIATKEGGVLFNCDGEYTLEGDAQNADYSHSELKRAGFIASCGPRLSEQLPIQEIIPSMDEDKDICINKLYSHGAGEIHIYYPQSCETEFE